MRAAAEDLKRYGATVVPAFSSEEDFSRWKERVWQAMDEFPEYKVHGRNAQRVLGGFGAYANPASFHHPTIQRLRTELKRRVSRPLFLRYVRRPDANVEVLFDRLCVRHATFGTVTAEAWHRDIYDHAKYGVRPLAQRDELFGGWVNLSDEVQRFRGILGSHTEPEAMRAQERGGGFALLTKAEIAQQCVDARLAAQAGGTFGGMRCTADGDVQVPPGHMLVFYQRLLHAVAPSKPPTTPQLRLFFGHRVTLEQTPLFPLDLILLDNRVPRIPSGQIPPMYSQNHYAFFSRTPKYREWGQKTFKTQCLYERTTPSGMPYATPGSRNNLEPSCNLSRSMPSLTRMGFPAYAYTEATRATMTPETLDLYGPDTDVLEAED